MTTELPGMHGGRKPDSDSDSDSSLFNVYPIGFNEERRGRVTVEMMDSDSDFWPTFTVTGGSISPDRMIQTMSRVA
jgi:hypothetical protein